MDEPDLIYRYDPRPEVTEPKPLGVEGGWVVIWNGKPGPAKVAKAGMIHEGDGNVDVVLTSDFSDCEVTGD